MQSLFRTVKATARHKTVSAYVDAIVLLFFHFIIIVLHGYVYLIITFMLQVINDLGAKYETFVEIRSNLEEGAKVMAS